MKNEKIYLLTDGCMWEANKQNGTTYPHAIEVVDIETGAVQYIKSGSRIAFVDGQITETRSQEAYNKKVAVLPLQRKEVLQGTDSKTKGKSAKQ